MITFQQFCEEVYEDGTDEYREYLENLTPGQKKKKKSKAVNEVAPVVAAIGRTLSTAGSITGRALGAAGSLALDSGSVIKKLKKKKTDKEGNNENI